MTVKTSSPKAGINKGRKTNEFHSMFGDHPAPVWIHDRETLAFLEMNRAAFSLLGYQQPHLKKITLEDIFPTDKNPHLYDDLKLGRQNGHSPTGWLRSSNGQLISVALTVSQMDYGGREAVLVIVHFVHEQTVERRILEARLRISEFAHSHPLDELLQKTLDEAELLTDSNIGFFHFVEKDQKTLSLQNWSTNTLKNMCTAEGKWSHYAIDQAGVWVDCVRQRSPVIYNDYGILKHRKGMPPGHAAVTRLLTTPVMRGDVVVAILGVGNKPVDYDNADVTTVNLLADLAWDITGRMRAEQESRVAEENYRVVFENAKVGIFQSTPDGVFRKVNPEMARIFGYDSPAEMISSVTDISRQIYFDEAKREEFINSINQSGEVLDFIMGSIRKDGSLIWTSMNARAVRDEKGSVLYYEGFLLDVTASRQAEDALRESEEKYRQLFEAESDAIFLIDNATGQIYEANSAASKIYGYSHEELLHLRNLDLSAEPDNTRKAMQEHETNIPIRWHKKRDGTVFPAEISASHLMWNGRAIHIAAIRDITERKQTEDALQESEVQYRIMFQNNPHPMWVYDRETLEFLEVNDAAINQYGYSLEEFMKMTIVDIRPTEDIPGLHEHLTGNVLQGYRAGIWKHRKKDGSLFDVEVTRHDTIFNGRPARLVLANDVTERKRAEDALRENEMRYRIVADNTSDWEFWQGPDGQFIYLSPSCKDITGHDAEEFVDDPGLLERIVHPDDLEFFKEHKHSAALNKATEEIEFRILLPNGEVCWIGHVCQPVFDDQKNYLGVRGGNRNITARKQAEEGLQLAKESLEDINRVLLGAFEREKIISRTDSLTESYNRRHFFEAASHEFSVAKRYGQALSLIMFDIDHFKKFNDLYGHQIGDEILRRITKIARDQLRSADILARYGGEEFTVLLPNSGVQEAFLVAERIREAVEVYKLLTENESVSVTISIGVVEYHPDIQTLDQLIKNADKAMYAAKQAGRNCTMTYMPEA